MSDQETVQQEVSGGESISSQTNSQSGFDPQDIGKHKVVACLSYVSLLFLIPLLTAKESRFAQFHAKQGMALFIAWVGIVIALSIIPMMLGIMFIQIVNLFFIIVSIVGIVKALGGEAWEMPGASWIVAKLNL